MLVPVLGGWCDRDGIEGVHGRANQQDEGQAQGPRLRPTPPLVPTRGDGLRPIEGKERGRGGNSYHLIIVITVE